VSPAIEAPLSYFWQIGSVAVIINRIYEWHIRDVTKKSPPTPEDPVKEEARDLAWILRQDAEDAWRERAVRFKGSLPLPEDSYCRRVYAELNKRLEQIRKGNEYVEMISSRVVRLERKFIRTSEVSGKPSAECAELMMEPLHKQMTEELLNGISLSALLSSKDHSSSDWHKPWAPSR